ncbi:MAG TPA: hypothetical protein VK724_14485 [Bryobacteraceae bacterium]|jgi:hypothetical protein|nr:hypothetical protein [Bryobacteraceae bacterium]
MQFILTGFTQDIGFRVFAFEGVAIGQIRTAFTVRADLALSRRYGIAMQELPLLCRGLLDRRSDGVETEVESVENHSLIFSEDEMRACADKRATDKALAALKRKAPRRPVVENAGAAWRGPQA